MGNMPWAAFVRNKRKLRRLTRRRMAEYAGIDPSYVTLIERDGYVPRRDKVLAIARALNQDETETLLVAGYANQQVAKVYRSTATDLGLNLAAPLLAQVKRLARLAPNKQKLMAKGLQNLLEVVNG